MSASSQADAVKIVMNFGNSGKPTDLSPAGWGNMRNDLVKELMDRVTGAVLPSQEGTSLCGPAAFAFCLLQDRPDIYAQFVVDLWNDGKATLGSNSNVRSMELEPSFQLRKNTALAVSGTGGRSGIAAVDWMFLGTLRGYDGAYSHPFSDAAAITVPGTMQLWFDAVSSKKIMDTTRSLSRASWDDLLKISCFVSGSWVVMLINASLLRLGGGGPGSWHGDHWVVATSMVHINKQYSSKLVGNVCVDPRSGTTPDNKWPIDFKVFSWGDKNHTFKNAPNASVDFFFERYHGAFVFSSIP